MMTAGQAMKIWQKLLHEDDEVCCTNSHEYFVQKNQVAPKPDDMVCERELAWRTYVRIRDNNPNFPFDQQQIH